MLLPKMPFLESHNSCLFLKLRRLSNWSVCVCPKWGLLYSVSDYGCHLGMIQALSDQIQICKKSYNSSYLCENEICHFLNCCNEFNYFLTVKA